MKECSKLPQDLPLYPLQLGCVIRKMPPNSLWGAPQSKSCISPEDITFPSCLSGIGCLFSLRSASHWGRRCCPALFALSTPSFCLLPQPPGGTRPPCQLSCSPLHIQCRAEHLGHLLLHCHCSRHALGDFSIQVEAHPCPVASQFAVLVTSTIPTVTPCY